MNVLNNEYDAKIEQQNYTYELDLKSKNDIINSLKEENNKLKNNINDYHSHLDQSNKTKKIYEDELKKNNNDIE